MTFRKTLIGACLAIAPLTLPAAAQELTEDRVRELVLETILENPGIVMEAVAILEQREAEAQAARVAEALGSERGRLESSDNAVVFGNPEGDVTIVEFFDYNCGFCRRASPEMQTLLSEDEEVRVVMRELPILGEGSVFAARAALASREQGLYEPFHWAMMEHRGQLDPQGVLRVAEEVGLDPERLVADMNAPEIDAHIQTSLELARALGISGTPSFVIGDRLIPGLIDSTEMAALVADMRNAE